MDHGDAAVMAALAEGNREYEQRFGRVFIRAAGRSSSEVLAEPRRRLGNDDAPSGPRRSLRCARSPCSD